MLTATYLRQRHTKWYIQWNGRLLPAPADPHDPVAAKVIFVDALEAINEAAAIALHQPVEIATIGRPRHFKDSSHMAVIEVAEDVGTLLETPWQTVGFPSAVRLAYGLDSCAAFGLLDSDDCDIDEGPHYIVYVEYHKEYLEIMMEDVDEITLNIVDNARYPERGENSITRTASRTNRLAKQKSTMPTSGSHYQCIQDTFRTFLTKYQLTAEVIRHLEYLHAVIISGEASKLTFEPLRNAISTVLADQRDKIRDSINPLYAGAVGAAHRGRYLLLNPQTMDFELCTLTVDGHDEL